MRLLLIEDEHTLRQQLAKTMTEAGFIVEMAVDGEEGLYQGQEYPYDLAVVDLGLPKLSGIDVIKRWRSEGRDFPVLILNDRGRWQEKVE